jgi:hypothetical protein
MAGLEINSRIFIPFDVDLDKKNLRIFAVF